MTPVDQLKVIEQEARRLHEDIELRRCIVTPDIRRIAAALVRFFDALR